LPLADELVLTEVDADLDGECFFPTWERSAFEQTAHVPATTASGVAYHFNTYRRRQP
jgi:dihydrofolate reductase